MAKIKNSVQKQNLAAYQTWIVDNDPSSRYFRLAQIPEVFTAGKNAFLINGSTELEPTTEVKIEILDSAGNPLFIHPVKNYAEGMARVISVEVYEDTPAGPATITILGHLRHDADGNTPPDEFVKAYNVKWTKQVVIAPEKPNTSPIRLYDTPTLTVSELLVPFRSASLSAPVTIQTGSVTLNSTLTTPGNETSRITTLSRVGTAISLTSAMNGGIFMATVNGAPYTASLSKVVNNSTAILSVGFPSSSGQPVTVSDYKIVYNPVPTFALTPETRSFANVQLDKLSTFSGEIRRVKVYGRSIDQMGDYQIIGDFPVSSPEVTVTQSLATGEPIVRLGQLTSQTFLTTYWNAGTFAGTNYVVDPLLPLQTSSVVIADAMRLNENSLVAGGSAVPRYFIGTKNPLNFVYNREYNVTANVACVNTGNFDARMDVYLFGSAFPSSSADSYGVLVTSLTLPAGESRRDFGSVSANVIASNTGTAYLRFVLYAGDWNIGNVVVNHAVERGFNTDEVDALIPVYGRRLETMQFKAELYDVNSNLVPITIESPNVFFDGGNYAFRGTDNRVTGDLKVGSEGSGILMTAAGYTGSGGPVANAPAIIIGQGTFGNANTPFLVASSSNGTLFSLGDKLKWDGNNLQIQGDIALTPEQEARVANLEVSASRAAQSGSAVATSASRALTSASTLDSRIFTDNTGRISRPPTGSAPGLYVGQNFLGYYSGSNWQTYMNNLGHFVLTGSVGTDNYLSWNGSSLKIAGDITITAGSTLATIQNASSSAATATNTANAASSTAANASASAATATTAAANASASAANSLNVATTAQNTAIAAQTSASNAVDAAAAAQSQAALTDAKVFTDASGLVVKTPTGSTPGLYIGRTHLGYFSGSQWRTYMADNGNFFLTGSSGGHFLSWNGSTLTIAGAITLLSGPTSASIAAAQATASIASSSAVTAQGAANTAQSTANAATASAATANTAATNASASAAVARTSSSLLDARIFTDNTGRLVKTPSTGTAGLYIGATNLGYYSGSAWKTYMSNTGQFYLTGSLGQFLAWDGASLTIAGNVNIIGGQAATDIANAQNSASNAQTAANNAQSTANAATASAATAQTTANQASSSAVTAQASANAAQATANQATASAASASAYASTIDAKVFTDSSGKLVKTPSPTGEGLFLGSNFLGYYSGSAWKTYMSNTGNFYLTGSVGSSNYLTWDGNNLKIAGNIEIVAGDTLAAIQNAQVTANQATASAVSAQTTANTATASAATANTAATNASASAAVARNSASVAITSASVAQTTATTASASAVVAQSSASVAITSASNAQTAATNASASAATANTAATNASASAAVARTSSSLLDTKIFTDATGRLVKTPSTSSAGLYLGATNLGYYSGSQWKTYMDNFGKFYLTGSSSNYLAWDGTTLTIAGNINIVGGPTAAEIEAAQASATAAQNAAATAQSTANTATASAASAQTAATNASSSAAIANTTALNASSSAVVASTSASIASASAATATVTATDASSSAGIAIVSASRAQTTASNASSSAATANNTATNASASAAVARTSASLIDAKVFTDSNGKLVKTPNPTGAGLFIGSTYLGYYSGSAWKTYMSDTGRFFLTGSTNNYLTWDGASLTIAGNINIVAGPTYDAINDAQSTANAATASAATAQSTANAANSAAATAQTVANQATASAATAQTVANTATASAATAQSTANQATASAATAQSTANAAQTSANTAQSTANAATASAAAASASAAIARVSASLLDTKIFTNDKGELVKTPTPSGDGLFLGSTHLGYYSGSMWKTYISNTGNFFLTGSNGSSNFLSWDGTNLRIAGNITLLSGPSSASIAAAQDAANSANSAAATAQTTANTATASAATAQSTANTANTAATNASASAAIARTSASLASASAATAQNTATNASASAASTSASLSRVSASLLATEARVFTDSTGKITKTPDTSSAGLFLGNTYMGYYNGSAWKTYMSNTGNFFLSGTGINGLSWDGSNLNITGNITMTASDLAWGVAVASGQNLMTTVKDWTVQPTGSPAPQNFAFNGTPTENAIELGITPYGDTGKLWVCIPDGGNNAEGGWNTSPMEIDPTKTYRYVVWVKRSGGNDGSTYHGTGTSGVANITTGTANGNPYFWSGDLPTLNGDINNTDDWYLMVGYVFPHNYGTVQRNASGVWSKKTGQKVASGTDYKWLNASVTTGQWRSYFYYCTTTTPRQYFYSPMVHVVDGTEPSIDQILSMGATAWEFANNVSASLKLTNDSLVITNNTVSNNSASLAADITDTSSSLNTRITTVSGSTSTRINSVSSSLNTRITSVSSSTATTINGVDAKVFTDATGKLVKSPGSASGGSGLYVGLTHLGYFNGTAWKTYMANNGNFYLSGAGTNGLSWDGTTLSITGNVNITGGQAATDISNAQSTANNAQSAANTAQSTADNAQSTANNAQSTANTAQTSANNAQSTADSALSTANTANSNANTALNQIVTDTSTKIVKNAGWNGQGLYLGADYMGYKDASGNWGSYLGATGTFRFYQDSNNQIGWDGSTFFVKTQQLVANATNLLIDSVNQSIKLGSVAGGGSTGITISGTGKLTGGNAASSSAMEFDPTKTLGSLFVRGGVSTDSIWFPYEMTDPPMVVPEITFGYKNAASLGGNYVSTITFNVNGGRIEAKGDIIAYSTSDRTLKNEVTPIPDALRKIKKITGNTFVWNEKSVDAGKKDVGVIAQEVMEVLPESVRTVKFDQTPEPIMSVRYEKLIPLLIEGIKELSKEVEDLKAQLSKK